MKIITFCLNRRMNYENDLLTCLLNYSVSYKGTQRLLQPYLFSFITILIKNRTKCQVNISQTQIIQLDTYFFIFALK